MRKNRGEGSEQDLTVQDIIDAAVLAGLYPRWADGDTTPWTLVMRGTAKNDGIGKDSINIHEFYLKEKPLRDLAALEQTDPARHATLTAAKAKAGQWQKMVWGRAGRGEKTDWDQFYKDNEDLVQAEQDYKAFERAAVSDHRIDDIYGDISDAIRSVELGSYMHYLLFRNEKDGHHLSVMIDARHNLESPRYPDAKPNFVETNVFAADGRDEDQIREDVKWQWAAHFLHQNRYAPFYGPDIVKSLDEAERLRAKFNGAAHAERPAVGKEVFEFFPAFRRAYGGEAGFFQALVDVYGPKGNVRHCSDMGVAHSDWNHAVYNHGEETGVQYEIPSNKFLRLFEQMGKRDRADFEAAFNRFVAEILPTVIDDIADKGNKGYGIADKVANAMAYLKIAIEYGTGANHEAHWFDKFRDTQREMLDIASGGKRARYNKTRTFEERAPKF